LPDPLSGRVGGDSFYALNAATGAIVWKFDTIGQNMPTPVFLRSAAYRNRVSERRSEYVCIAGEDRCAALEETHARADLMASLNLYDNLIYGITGYSFLLYDSTYQKDGPNAARQMFQHTFAIDGSGASRWSQPYGARAVRQPSQTARFSSNRGFQRVATTRRRGAKNCGLRWWMGSLQRSDRTLAQRDRRARRANRSLKVAACV